MDFKNSFTLAKTSSMFVRVMMAFSDRFTSQHFLVPSNFLETKLKEPWLTLTRAQNLSLFEKIPWFRGSWFSNREVGPRTKVW